VKLGQFDESSMVMGICDDLRIFSTELSTANVENSATVILGSGVECGITIYINIL
jgi:hypothetical protein